MTTCTSTKPNAFLMSLPNCLSLLRVVLIAPIVYLLQLSQIQLALGLMVIAFATDFLDGKIARRYNVSSKTGSILDPVADKLIVVSLMLYFGASGQLPIWFICLVVLRDFLQLMAIPVLILWKKIGFKVKPKIIAKWATAIKFIILGMVFITMLGHGQHIEFLKESILLPLVIISAIMEVYILVTYIKRFTQIYNGTHDTFE